MEIEILTAMSNYGISGIMLFWFMFRMEKVVKNNTSALESHKIIIEKCKKTPPKKKNPKKQPKTNNYPPEEERFINFEKNINFKW